MTARKRSGRKSSSSRASVSKKRARKRQAQKEPEKAAEETPARSKATFDLPADLLQELRVASISVPLKAIGGSMSGLTERALRDAIAELRKVYNKGKPFEADEPVKGRRGRPPRV